MQAAIHGREIPTSSDEGSNSKFYLYVSTRSLDLQLLMLETNCDYFDPPLDTPIGLTNNAHQTLTRVDTTEATASLTEYTGAAGYWANHPEGRLARSQDR